MALILLRHTTPAVEPGVCYGQTDLDVASTFRDEAAVVASALPNVHHIVTSPLQRCRKLADVLSKMTGRTITEDCRIMEMDFGTWEERAWSDIPRDELDAWAADFLHARPHGGESVSMLRTRTLEALGQWHQNVGPVLIVTHAGVIKAALASGDTAADFATNIDFGGIVTISPPKGDSDE